MKVPSDSWFCWSLFLKGMALAVFTLVLVAIPIINLWEVKDTEPLLALSRYLMFGLWVMVLPTLAFSLHHFERWWEFRGTLIRLRRMEQ